MNSYLFSRNLIRGLLVLLILAIACGIAATGILWRKVHGAQRTVMPDGSSVELLGTSLGQETFTTEKKWQRIARRYLPGLMQKWIPTATSGNCSGSSNGLTVYLSVSPARTAGGPTPWQRYTTEDDSGFRYPPDGGYCSFGDAKGNLIYGLILSAFPRRQQEFLFRFLDQNGQVIGSLHVPNRSATPFPEWQPLPLPQTQSNGPVTLTLYGFEERVNGRWTNLNANWGLQAADTMWTRAKARDQKFVDATGNEGRFLSPREKAWKVHTLVFRQRPEDFAANEQLLLSNIPLPEAGTFTPLDKTADCVGVSLKALVLASAGRFGLSNGTSRFMLPASQGTGGHSISSGGGGTIETWGSPNPFLMLEARNVQPDDELLVRAWDQNDHQIKVEMNGYESSSGALRIYKPAFQPAPDSKSVTVQVILNRPLPFEFMVSPADVRRGP